MAGRKPARGACAYCGTETTKAAIARHLEKCPQRIEAVAKAESGPGEVETLLYLRVQDAYGGDFWLDLEMRGTATLKKLDEYLRAIWLECCGHLSEFSDGGWGGRKIGMSQPAAKAFAASPQLTHIYDFGTSSETRITLKSTRRGKPTTKHPIALLARNKMPEKPCDECGKAATHLCMECQFEHDQPGFLCDEHARNHPHDDYGEPMELVNSPRLGMCGYEGPADPPY